MWHLFKKLWRNFSKGLAKINSTILLTIFYFVILGLYVVIKKIAATLKGKSRKLSNWQVYINQPKTIKDVEHPF